MGLFSPTPKVTPEEWKRVREKLNDRGWGRRDLDDLESVIHQALQEPGRSWGMDKAELREIIRYLKKDKRSHHLSDAQIDEAEGTFQEYF